MNISIIGSGNTATVLAGLCVRKGHHIQQIIARNTKAAMELAQVSGGHHANFSLINPEITDFFIVALSDNALPEALAGIHFGDVPVVHTAGSVSINVLKNNARNYGVLYPLQSLRKDMAAIPPIPFLTEANNEKTALLIEKFARTLSDNVKAESEENRFRLHAAAVIVNNFTNYLYSLAEEFCKKEKVDFDLLKPLIIETAERIKHKSPVSLQTGPAVRNDLSTIEKHLSLLNDYPTLRSVYEILTKEIMKNSKN